VFSGLLRGSVRRDFAGLYRDVAVAVCISKEHAIIRLIKSRYFKALKDRTIIRPEA